jgi:hypothetical protein
MPYSDALVQHIKVLEFLDSHGAEQVAEQAREFALKTYGLSVSAADILSLERDALRQADTFYMEPSIQELLQNSASTFPRDIAIGDIGFPYPYGFLCFASPIDAPYHPDPCIGKWIGFAWSALDEIESSSPKSPWPDGPAVQVSYYHEDLSRNKLPILASTQLWSYSENVNDWERAHSARLQGTEGPHVFVAMCLAWLTQKLARVESTQATRPIRRRLERDGWHLKDAVVRRIILRPIDRANYGRSDSETSTWSCQWIVRSHWRNQYYSREKSHRPIWVLAHVKGPPDKPLKTQRAVVFDMAR